MSGVRRPAWVLTACACLLGPAAARADDARLPVQRRLTSLSNEVRSAVETIEFRLKEYADPTALMPRRPLPERLADAEILFLLRRYQEASLLFTELLPEVRADLKAEQAKVLSYLGEASYQIRNFSSARLYFGELLAAGDLRHATEALRRLVQIGDRTGDYRDLEAHVARLRQLTGSQLAPEIAYIYAKSLLRRAMPEPALQVLADVPADSFHGVKALYLRAIAATQQGLWPAALDLFAQAAQVASAWAARPELPADDQADLLALVDLTRMNRGRIYYEQGRFAEAADAYQDIDRGSPLFDRMLYEVSWGWVREAQKLTDLEQRAQYYQKALAMLDLLLVGEDANPLAPEARLLRGNLELRISRFEQARASFGEIFSRYQRVLGNLDSATAGYAQPREYFRKVLQTRQPGQLGWDKVLPTEALRWAREEQDLSQAVAVLGDIDQSKAWIRDGQNLIDKLLEALEGEQRAQFFPALSEAQSRMLELRNTCVLLAEQLTDLHAELVAADADAGLRAQLGQARADRLALQAAYKALPQTSSQYQARRDSLASQAARAQQEAYRLRYEIAALRGQVVALDKWLNDHAADLGVSGDEVKALRERIAFESQAVNQLERLQRQLEEEAERGRGLVKAANLEEARDRELRLRYQAAVRQEAALLAAARPASAAGDAITRIAVLQSQLQAAEARVEAFLQRMRDAINDQSRDLQAQVLAESAVFDAFAGDLRSLEGQGEELLSEIGLRSFEQVKDRFRELMLRADVGMLDLTWAQKEARTRGISADVDRKNRQVQLLRQEFGELADDERGE